MLLLFAVCYLMVDLSFLYVRQKFFFFDISAALGVWGVITYFTVDLKCFCTLRWISSLWHSEHVQKSHCVNTVWILLDRVSSLIVNCLPKCPCEHSCNYPRLKLTQIASCYLRVSIYSMFTFSIGVSDYS